jgi:hypothetical protein
MAESRDTEMSKQFANYPDLPHPPLPLLQKWINNLRLNSEAKSTKPAYAESYP